MKPLLSIRKLSKLVISEWMNQRGNYAPLGFSPLIQSLLNFSNDYIGFINENIGEQTDPKNIRWIVDRIEETLFEYWAPVEEVILQSQFPPYIELLSIGAAQLNSIIEKAKSLGLPATNVFLYLEKRPLARRYPFTDDFFIGAAYSEALEGKWESVAHELGHQIFWNAAFSVSTSATEIGFRYPLEGADSIFRYEVQKAVEDLQPKYKLSQTKMDKLSRTLENWFEEIFADVVGTRLLGQQYVDSSTRMVIEKCRNQDDLISDDGEHPPYYLRPYIGAFTLDRELDKKSLWQRLNQQLVIELAQQGVEINPDWKPNIAGFELDLVTRGVEAVIDIINKKINERHVRPIRETSKDFNNFKDWVLEVIESKNASPDNLIEYILTPRVLERAKSHSTKNKKCPEDNNKWMTSWACPDHYGP